MVPCMESYGIIRIICFHACYCMEALWIWIRVDTLDVSKHNCTSIVFISFKNYLPQITQNTNQYITRRKQWSKPKHILCIFITWLRNLDKYYTIWSFVAALQICGQVTSWSNFQGSNELSTHSGIQLKWLKPLKKHAYDKNTVLVGFFISWKAN